MHKKRVFAAVAMPPPMQPQPLVPPSEPPPPYLAAVHDPIVTHAVPPGTTFKFFIVHLYISKKLKRAKKSLKHAYFTGFFLF